MAFIQGDNGASRAQLSDEAFPAAGGAGLAAVTSGQWAGRDHGAGGGALAAEDFPALPGVHRGWLSEELCIEPCQPAGSSDSLMGTSALSMYGAAKTSQCRWATHMHICHHLHPTGLKQTSQTCKLTCHGSHLLDLVQQPAACKTVTPRVMLQGPSPRAGSSAPSSGRRSEARSPRCGRKPTQPWAEAQPHALQGRQRSSPRSSLQSATRPLGAIQDRGSGPAPPRRQAPRQRLLPQQL